jgi:hypothetical protein
MFVGFAVFAAIAAGLILLQIFLSKRESVWPGLILPGITFCGSLLFVLGMVVIGDRSSFIATSMLAFFYCNIPTCILLAIYFACRSKQKKRKALDRMSAQDLE